MKLIVLARITPIAVFRSFEREMSFVLLVWHIEKQLYNGGMAILKIKL